MTGAGEEYESAETTGVAAPVDELRARRERRIVPAGMSYERALQIAIAALDPDAERVDCFATDQLFKMPKSF